VIAIMPQVLSNSNFLNIEADIDQCTELTTVLGEGKAFYQTLPEDFASSYFSSRQREMTPACVVRPANPQDVSLALKMIGKHSCNFAIKSGGHGMFEGASNIEGGITIDLVSLDGIELSEDGETASIGPGNRWGKVYESLEERGRVVVGGRVSNVGVGGFMLGGELRGEEIVIRWEGLMRNRGYIVSWAEVWVGE
jgi:FAD/FMN-containing dehydrogenase